MIAAAEYGSYVAAEQQGAWSKKKQPPALPYNVQRVRICDRILWRLMPWELDEFLLKDISVPLAEHLIFEAFLQEGKDLKGLSPGQYDVVQTVRRLMDARNSRNSNKRP